jgi:hypothetical protein
MTPLPDIIAEMEKDGRQPRILIDAHKETLTALEALAKRIARLEKPQQKRK